MGIPGIIAKYECPSCGHVMNITRPLIRFGRNFKFEEPDKCRCGRSERFTLLDFKKVSLVVEGEKNEN